MSQGAGALARSTIDALLEAASAAADEGARRDVKLAMDAARGFLDAVRASLTARYAWGAAYGELLELRSQVEEARRHHGV